MESDILMFVGGVGMFAAFLGSYRASINASGMSEIMRKGGPMWLAAIVLISIAAFLQSRSTSTLTQGSQGSSVKGKYLGEWKAPKGRATIKIYEQDGGVFAKFWKGEIMPLTFQEEGQYYEGTTVIGAMPLIIENDTLRYSQSKYIRVSN